MLVPARPVRVSGMDAASGILPDYAELFCRSNFSFLHGASSAEELVERAAKQGYRGIAITDECSLAGAPRMHVAAKAVGLPLVVGAYFGVTPDDAAPGHDPGPARSASCCSRKTARATGTCPS